MHKIKHISRILYMTIKQMNFSMLSFFRNPLSIFVKIRNVASQLAF